ncbi:hypothetical protein [uncultured Kiloniella sp.]|uniref:hypothetical protein n=1 Tax=uncultured Kiloniella sp. TaxID=1133091 RepID=UPI002639F199|nr:hypothetical protein [uncultured Kiloniella sp.]
MTLANVAIRSGVGFVVGSAIGRVFRPVTTTVKTAGTMITNANKSIVRSAETQELVSETKDVVRRMNLQTEQRQALIDFGNNSIELNSKFNDFDNDTQATLNAWEQKLPDVI